MTITTFWASTPSVVSQQPGWVTPDVADFAVPPATLDPAVFRTWTPTKQAEYILANGGSPLEIGPPLQAVTVTLGEAQTISLTLPDEGDRAFTTAGMPRDMTFAEYNTPPASLDIKFFLAWKQGDQISYIQRHSTSNPPSLSFAGNAGSPSVQATVVPDVTIADGVIQPTSGDFEKIPYHYLPGGTSGTNSAVIQASAEALFPSLDGETTTLAVDRRPPEFYTTPAMLASATEEEVTAFLKGFTNWHSAYQLEYIKKHGTAGVLNIPPSPAEPRLTVVVSTSDPRKLFNLQALQKNDFARMTLAEQQQISALPAFVAHATRLGLSTDIAGMTALADELIADIDTRVASNITPPFAQASPNPALYPLNIAFSANQPANPVDPNTGGPYYHEGGILAYRLRPGTATQYDLVVLPLVPEDGRNAFITQLSILKEQLAGMAVVSPADVRNKIEALRERFERVFAFWNIRDMNIRNEGMGTPNVTAPVYRDAITPDGGMDGVRRGYEIFIAQEKRIAELAEARMQIARDDGSLFGRSLDVPGLVFQFQGLYNLALEAEVVAETEEINQQNDLLKTYAAIQDIINKTLATLTSSSSDSKRRVLGKGVDDYRGDQNNFKDNERILINMFDDSISGQPAFPPPLGQQKHPLETLRSINRPLHAFFEYRPGTGDHLDLEEYTHTQWSTFGTRLSETVTLINQNSQMKMNDVNSLDKQRNRHFELANNALSKMSEMVQSIARSI